MKLTRELLEVMDSDSEGTPSELFDYFKVGNVLLHGWQGVTCRVSFERREGVGYLLFSALIQGLLAVQGATPAAVHHML
jgi:hypothetical protein